MSPIRAGAVLLACAALAAGCGGDDGPSHTVVAQTDCAGCHLGLYQKTHAPDHVALGISQTCDTCHGTTAWEGAAFPMHDQVFPLEGGHATLGCEDCHGGGSFAGTPAQCAGCHTADYEATVEPDHAGDGFPTACATCHTSAAWGPSTWQGHAWPLEGQHAAATCASCHTGGTLAPATDCAGCHLADYQSAQQPDHVASALPTTCDSCHTPAAWAPATLDHDALWPLEGKHAQADCASCHTGGDYAAAPTTCDGCHLQDYEGATDPDHVASALPTACAACHTPAGWAPAKLDHDVLWPLEGKHDAAPCGSCHVDGVYVYTPTTCDGCHLPDYQGAKDPDHVATQLPTTCDACHTASGWAPAALQHDEFWPLEGQHEKAQCASCHEGGSYAGTPTACAGCHLADYQGAPDHEAKGLPTTCDTCHSPVAWEGAEFEHVWPLEGEHAGVTCASCHGGGVYDGTPKTCDGCHLPEFLATKDPDHLAAGLPTTCDACHTVSGWEPAALDHDQYWPLLGQHAQADCASCHTAGYDGTPSACVGCHGDDLQAVKDPDHVAQGFPTTCETCHTSVAWEPAGFEHEWPLTGEHTTAPCAACHGGGVFAGTPDTCWGCHSPDYLSAKDPDHDAHHLPTTCDACHGTAGWAPASFDGHDAYWPLDGQHEQAACESCHVNGLYAGTPKECKGCHLPDYQQTTDPPHAAAGYPQSCGVCHASSGWVPASYEGHDAWPLEGQHAQAQCTACHGGGQFEGTPTACVGCHQPDYAATKDPDHEAQAFPTTCGACHGSTGWSPASYDGHDEHFPLTGAHDAADCASCHVGGKFAGTPQDCAGCHLGDFAATTDPDHEAQGFPGTCEACHGTAAWKPASYTGHDDYWPLTGKHEATACGQCHQGGVYQGTPTACWGCHQGDFAATTDPDHGLAKLPQTCDTCHATAAWEPSTFDHAQHWPLTGAHQDASCAGCHVGGQYAGTPTTCKSCHLGDWQGAKSPDHAALAIPQTCDTCHATASWATNEFPQHDGVFLISKGKHSNKDCAECHKVPDDWSVFTCVDCHELTKMNDEHKEKPNYFTEMGSAPTPDHGCLGCHPDGKE